MSKYVIAILLAFGLWLVLTRGPVLVSEHGYVVSPGVKYLGDDGKVRGW